jgi:hypothetical protein
MRKFALVVAVLAVAVAPACLFAQAAAQSSTQEVKEPEHYYKLNFTLEELNDAGKVANSRNYVATIVTGRGGTQEIRTGSRIPIATGTENGSTQFQYIDVGVSVEGSWRQAWILVDGGGEQPGPAGQCNDGYGGERSGDSAE